jgi:hypothetical protein
VDLVYMALLQLLLPLYCLLAACATVAAVAVRLLHHCVQLVLLLYRCCTARIACTAVIAHTGCVAAGAGYRKMNPFCIPFAITNMSGALLAMDLGFMGPNYAINTACATGNYCITNAADHIARGDADLMLAGSADASVIPSGIGGFIACKALSKRNDQPQTASRPWDRERDGFVMGEGAGGNLGQAQHQVKSCKCFCRTQAYAAYYTGASQHRSLLDV